MTFVSFAHPEGAISEGDLRILWTEISHLFSRMADLSDLLRLPEAPVVMHWDDPDEIGRSANRDLVLSIAEPQVDLSEGLLEELNTLLYGLCQFIKRWISGRALGVSSVRIGLTFYSHDLWEGCSIS